MTGVTFHTLVYSARLVHTKEIIMARVTFHTFNVFL